MTLVTNGTPGNDQSISAAKIEYSRNFGNKLWQISKFVLSNLGDGFTRPSATITDASRLPERWIVSRLNGLITNVQHLFDSYQYGEAGRQIQDFIWTEFADWYIEISKSALYGTDVGYKAQTQAVLLHLLESCLKLLHPFMPFVTEEIWSFLPGHSTPLLIAAWPLADTTRIDSVAEMQMDTVRDLVVKVRNVRAEYAVEPGKRIQAVAVGNVAKLVVDYADIFSRLCNVEQITLSETIPDQTAVIVSSEVTLALPLAGMVNFAAERERLTAELANVTAQIEKIEKTLGNEGFVSRAKPEVVARERARLVEMRQTHETLTTRLQTLPG